MAEQRRTVLRAMAAAGAVVTAGCSDGRLGAAGGTDEPARYSDFVAAESVEDSTSVLSFDWGKLSQLQDDGTDEGTPTPSPDDGGGLGSSDDPLAGYPIAVLFGGLFGIGFAAGVAGLGRLSEFGGPTQQVHFVGDAGLVFEGSFEPSEIASDLEENGLADPTEYEGYELYEGENAGGELAVATSEETVVLVSSGESVEDPAATVRRVVDSEAGRIERYREAKSTFERLTTALDAGVIQSVQFTEQGDVRETDEDDSETQISLEGEIRGVVSSASLTASELTSQLGFLFASESEVPAQTDLEVEFGNSASEREISIDDRLVVITGTYRDDAVGGDAPLS